MKLKHCFTAWLVFSATALAGPLDNWHARSTFGGTNLNDIAYGAGVYVIVQSTPGRIFTSASLQDRLPNVTIFEAPHSLYSVIYETGKFVAAGASGVLVSTNGLDWESHSFSEILNLRSVIYAQNRFVAAGWSGIITSETGNDWKRAKISSNSSPVTLWPGDIAHGNGTFVVASWDNSTANSDDGLAWQLTSMDAKFYTIGFGNGRFVGLSVGSFGDNIYNSLDGRRWTSHGRLELQRPTAIAWGNGYYVTGGGQARLQP